jgi:hypothetical protein
MCVYISDIVSVIGPFVPCIVFVFINDPFFALRLPFRSNTSRMWHATSRRTSVAEQKSFSFNPSTFCHFVKRMDNNKETEYETITLNKNEKERKTDRHCQLKLFRTLKRACVHKSRSKKKFSSSFSSLLRAVCAEIHKIKRSFYWIYYKNLQHYHDKVSTNKAKKREGEREEKDINAIYLFYTCFACYYLP